MTCGLSRDIDLICERDPDRPFDVPDAGDDGEASCRTCSVAHALQDQSPPASFREPLTKHAKEFLNELANTIVWIEPIAIVLIERDVRPGEHVNWAATISPSLASTKDEFEKMVSKWRSLNLQLDWEGTESRGDRRMLTEWIFPPDIDESTAPGMMMWHLTS